MGILIYRYFSTMAPASKCLWPTPGCQSSIARAPERSGRVTIMPASTKTRMRAAGTHQGELRFVAKTSATEPSCATERTLMMARGRSTEPEGDRRAPSLALWFIHHAPSYLSMNRLRGNEIPVFRYFYPYGNIHPSIPSIDNRVAWQLPIACVKSLCARRCRATSESVEDVVDHVIGKAKTCTKPEPAH